MSNLSSLLTTREVGDRLEIGTRQVARLVQRGKLYPTAQAPGARGAFLFSREDVDQIQNARGER